jgi:hypothetical protein
VLPYAYDPFAALVAQQAPTRAAGHSLSSSTLEIPAEDHDLFEQLRSDPKMTNIRDEIAHNKYLRILLQREFDQQSLDGRAKLAAKIVGTVRELYGEDTEVEGLLYRKLESALPAAKMSVALARAMSKLIETSGKLAEQQQKILEGTEIIIKGDSRKRMQDVFGQVIRPCCSPETWAAIRDRAASFVFDVGSKESLELT